MQPLSVLVNVERSLTLSVSHSHAFNSHFHATIQPAPKFRESLCESGEGVRFPRERG